MTVETVKNSFSMNKLSNIHFNEEKEDIYFTIYLLHERDNPKSKWKEYIDCFPNGVEYFPQKFSQQELKQLEGSPLFDYVKDYKPLKNDYNSIVEVLPDFKKYSFEEFKKMIILIKSRLFTINVDGKKNI